MLQTTKVSTEINYYAEINYHIINLTLIMQLHEITNKKQLLMKNNHSFSRCTISQTFNKDVNARQMPK